MARMIPDYIHKDCKSNAERKLFKRFKEELPNNYIVMHSLGLANHPRKLRAEIDFVVLSKHGLLCLEVKGGRIDFKEGVWRFTNRYDEVTLKRESPFEQAGSAMYALKRAIEKRFGKKSPQNNMVIGHLVIFTDEKFTKESPEWDLLRLVDKRTIETPIKKLLDGQLLYSRKEIERVSGGNYLCDLTNVELDSLVNFLRGDFEMVPPLCSVVENAHLELLRLTEEQYEVLDQLDGNPRVIVNGGAGTGKTLLATEKVRRAASEGKKVLFLCFNKLLSRHVRKRLANVESKENIEVWTLHSFAKKIIDDAGLGEFLKATNNNLLFKAVYPELFVQAIIDTSIEPTFDLLVIDEGQDLKYEPYLDMLDLLLKGGLKDGNWYWFEDDQQNIFVKNEDSENAGLDNYTTAFFRLTRNCRNTKPISLFNSIATGTKSQKCLLAEGIKVEPIVYRSKGHQLKELENVMTRLLGGGVVPQDIVVLTPISFEKSVLSGLKSLAGIKLSKYEICSGSPKSIRHSTIQGFKGLESKVVVVADIEDIKTLDSRSLNYVAFSRATTCLQILISEDAQDQLFEMVMAYADK